LLPFKRQTLDWEECGANECTDLEVPLDYAAPEGDTLQIAVVRNRANDADRRIGSLIINPGGPGGSGVDYVASGDGIVTSAIAARFDLVGFDPRGVSRSAPLRCLSSEDADRFYAYDGSPDTDAEATGALLLGRRFATLCEREAKDVLPFLGTRDAARDMDILRAALDEEKLNYIGKSYGTYLGAEYLRQFPETSGRLVLDGAVDPSLDADGFARGQATGFQRALESFLADCARRSDCPLGRDAEAAEAQLEEFLEELDSTPLEVGDRELTQALATLGVLASFYSTRSWERLRAALADGLDGDGAGLLALADFYSDRNADGTYGDNGLDAFYGIACMDRDDPKNVEQTAALATTLTDEVSAIFGAYLAWGNTPCQSWPLEPTLPGQPVAAPGVGPIVVVGTTRDPATPYEWSQALAEQLEQGRLITFDGDGHTAYGGASECVDDAVDAYLISGDDPGELDCP
jgi:pimeloyl-ACP methyl ester carboxylesterase